MDFFSLQFFAFSLAVLVLFYLVPVRLRWFLLLAASYSFYATFNVAYLGLIIFSTLSAYLAALGMNRWSKPSTRKALLILGLVSNIGLLLVFKYFDFFDASLQKLLGMGSISYAGHALNLLVPVGISFYVFQIASYLLDVYRKDTGAEKHPGIFALYVAFFPKLLSGPIERVKNFLPQLREKQVFDSERFTNGLKLICWGLFKKTVIADRLAAFVNVVYADPSSYAGPSLVLAVVFYSFQIYCDFSGYTDIAIGLSQMFGFRLTDNFNRPYQARSVSDFWRRWHISLSSWLRDYLYIPLGGNRVPIRRHYLNYLLVFFICGLWHGASWTFVVWGLIHGSYLVAGQATAGIRMTVVSALGLNPNSVLRRGLQVVITFALISLAWIFFRADSVADAWYILSHLHVGWEKVLDIKALSAMLFLTKSKIDLALVVVVLILLGVVHHLEPHENMRKMFNGKPGWIRFTLYYIMVAGLLILSAPDAANFIYFQF